MGIQSIDGRLLYWATLPPVKEKKTKKQLQHYSFTVQKTEEETVGLGIGDVTCMEVGIFLPTRHLDKMLAVDILKRRDMCQIWSDVAYHIDMSNKSTTCTVHVHIVTSVSGDGGDGEGVGGNKAAEWPLFESECQRL